MVVTPTVVALLVTGGVIPVVFAGEVAGKWTYVISRDWTGFCSHLVFMWDKCIVKRHAVDLPYNLSSMGLFKFPIEKLPLCSINISIFYMTDFFYNGLLWKFTWSTIWTFDCTRMCDINWTVEENKETQWHWENRGFGIIVRGPLSESLNVSSELIWKQ